MFNSGSSRSVRAAFLTVVVVLLASCGSAERPTITNDRLLPPELSAPTATPDTGTPVADPDAGADDNETAETGETGETAETEETEEAGQTATQNGVEFLIVEILEQLPHDSGAFTQGLELHDGEFVESTGQYGESSIRRVVPATGEVLQSVEIDERFFAEGVTRVGDELIQLTWQENTAFYWDATTLTVTREERYEGEGWGLCYDGSQLIMSDGTPNLTFRNPETFAETGQVSVAFNGQELWNLNELECVNGSVWANIWLTNQIVQIDPSTGTVLALVDAIGLNPPTEPDGAVLNGIAWDESTQSFYVTGKYWSNMYRVNFVPAG